MFATPIIVFVAAIVLAVVFEISHAYVDRRWTTPLDKAAWAAVFWTSVLIVGAASRIIPVGQPMTFVWAPFHFVWLVHLGVYIAGETFSVESKWRKPPSTRGASAGTCSTSGHLAHKRQDRQCQQGNGGSHNALLRDK